MGEAKVRRLPPVQRKGVPREGRPPTPAPPPLLPPVPLSRRPLSPASPISGAQQLSRGPQLSGAQQVLWARASIISAISSSCPLFNEKECRGKVSSYTRNPIPDTRDPKPWVYLRILVYLVIYDSGKVSLEHLLLSWYPSQLMPL